VLIVEDFRKNDTDLLVLELKVRRDFDVIHRRVDSGPGKCTRAPGTPKNWNLVLSDYGDARFFRHGGDENYCADRSMESALHFRFPAPSVRDNAKFARR